MVIAFLLLLVYKFKKIMGRTGFYGQFRKIIIRHRRINVMRQSACFAINPVMVDNFDALFNCMPVADLASDSMMAST